MKRTSRMLGGMLRGMRMKTDKLRGSCMRQRGLEQRRGETMGDVKRKGEGSRIVSDRE